MWAEIWASWGGGPIFTYICLHMAWTIFGVQNFEIQYFGGFQKNENFFGYEEIVDIFGVITLLDWFVGSFLYILGPFLKARFRMGMFLGVTKIQIFIMECLILLIFSLG